jgi:hypothetical protein
MNHSYGGNLNTSTSSLSGQMNQSPLWKNSYNTQPGNLPQKMSSQFNSGNTSANSLWQKNSPYSSQPYDGQLDSHISGPSKFTDAFVFHTADSYPNSSGLSQVGRELSLQDINRYMFQGSQSSEPGLPVTEAGGTAGQPNFSNSTSLTSLPATFDGMALRGGVVHSGTSDEMQVMNQDGTKPYQPPQGGLSANLPAPTNYTTSTEKQDSAFDTVYSQTMQQSSANNGSSSALPSGASLMPAGTYQATTANGQSIPVQTSAPRMFIQVSHGSSYKIEPATPIGNSNHP